MIEIDGMLGEGGGQVLRSSLTLSLLSGQPVHLTRIRAGRDKPGLRPQHRTAVQAAARIGRARVEGDRACSTELTFAPARVTAGDYHFDIGTAGAASLVLQTILLPLALAAGESRLLIGGGTHVPRSPCFHYLDWHWRVLLARLGVSFDLDMPMAGFYPQGGGLLRAVLPGGARLRGVVLQARRRLLRVRGLSAVANLPGEIGERQRKTALRLMRGIGCPVQIDCAALPARSRGTVLVLLAEFAASQACFFALGARGKRAEWVADEAVRALLGFLARDGAVDGWLADQLLLPLACAGQPSLLRTGEVTRHLLTQAEVIRRFVPVGISVSGAPGEPGTVAIRGWPGGNATPAGTRQSADPGRPC